jgi:hypothetical protein
MDSKWVLLLAVLIFSPVGIRLYSQSGQKSSLLKAYKLIHIRTARSGASEPTAGRIFVVGLPKAGTSSLHAYLTKSGISSCHQNCRNGSVRINTIKICQNALRDEPLLQGFEFVDAFTQLDNLLPCDKNLTCKSCWPQMTMIRALDKQYPGSKFILNARNIADHVDSIMRWGNLADRIQANDVPFFSKRKGNITENLADWISSHNNFIRKYFGNSSDFIEIDIQNATDASLKLNAFLGLNESWPHANANPKRD